MRRLTQEPNIVDSWGLVKSIQKAIGTKNGGSDMMKGAKIEK